VRPCSAPPASYRRLTGESGTLKSPTVAAGGEKGFSAKVECIRDEEHQDMETLSTHNITPRTHFKTRMNEILDIAVKFTCV
jgi:long-subunit fatty acid transport protein